MLQSKDPRRLSALCSSFFQLHWHVFSCFLPSAPLSPSSVVSIHVCSLSKHMAAHRPEKNSSNSFHKHCHCNRPYLEMAVGLNIECPLSSGQDEFNIHFFSGIQPASLANPVNVLHGDAVKYADDFHSEHVAFQNPLQCLFNVFLGIKLIIKHCNF